MKWMEMIHCYYHVIHIYIMILVYDDLIKNLLRWKDYYIEDEMIMMIDECPELCWLFSW